jgi:hypothetical protein
MIDVVGYIGMIILTYGFFLKNRAKMHLVLAISALILGIYSYLIESVPFIALNIISIAINTYRYFEFKKENEEKNNG